MREITIDSAILNFRFRLQKITTILLSKYKANARRIYSEIWNPPARNWTPNANPAYAKFNLPPVLNPFSTKNKISGNHTAALK